MPTRNNCDSIGQTSSNIKQSVRGSSKMQTQKKIHLEMLQKKDNPHEEREVFAYFL